MSNKKLSIGKVALRFLYSRMKPISLKQLIFQAKTDLKITKADTLFLNGLYQIALQVAYFRIKGNIIALHFTNRNFFMIQFFVTIYFNKIANVNLENLIFNFEERGFRQGGL